MYPIMKKLLPFPLDQKLKLMNALSVLDLCNAFIYLYKNGGDNMCMALLLEPRLFAYLYFEVKQNNFIREIKEGREREISREI